MAASQSNNGGFYKGMLDDSQKQQILDNIQKQRNTEFEKQFSTKEK